DFGWRVELNTRALPRVLVNEVYAAEIRRGAKRDEDRQYVSAQLQAANWLTRSLEQRARTILSVASEIVRRQDAFLVEGVKGLKPLNLKMVGEAHSAEAVRQRIRRMIEAEDPEDVLSDELIVERLREADILVARRTVAKYRDSLKIPSSVARRKIKMAPMRARLERDNSLTVEA